MSTVYLEGTDGVGKTTICGMIVEYLCKKNIGSETEERLQHL